MNEHGRINAAQEVDKIGQVIEQGDPAEGSLSSALRQIGINMYRQHGKLGVGGSLVKKFTYMMGKSEGWTEQQMDQQVQIGFNLAEQGEIKTFDNSDL